MVRVLPSSSRGTGLVALPLKTGLTRRHILCRRSFVRQWRLFLFAIALVALATSYRMRIVVADEWQPISPEELKMTSLPEPPEAPAVIFYPHAYVNDPPP